MWVSGLTPPVLSVSAELFSFGSQGLSCSVETVSSLLESPGNAGLCFPGMELTKWIIVMAAKNLHCTLNGMPLLEAGGIWQQILCWAGRVPAGDSVHRGCFRGVLVILPCCAWEWFWLSPELCRLIPVEFGCRASWEAKPRAPEHGGSSGSPLGAALLLLCCALGAAWDGQTSPGPAQAGAHTADLTVGTNLNFKVFYFFTEGKASDISSVFSDTLAFHYSCFQFRCFREERGKRRG